MAWEFLVTALYVLGVLTLFVMSLTWSQEPNKKPRQVTSEPKPDEIIQKKAA